MLLFTVGGLEFRNLKVKLIDLLKILFVDGRCCRFRICAALFALTVVDCVLLRQLLQSFLELGLQSCNFSLLEVDGLFLFLDPLRLVFCSRLLAVWRLAVLSVVRHGLFGLSELHKGGDRLLLVC